LAPRSASYVLGGAAPLALDNALQAAMFFPEAEALLRSVVV
jgi:hypothetical protein